MCTMVLTASAANKATRKASKATYQLPGSELVTGAKDGNIRAWAVGKADSQTAARMIAMRNASGELAEAVERSVESTLSSYALTEMAGDTATSKEAVSKQMQITAKQQLKGAVVIFDSWDPKDAEGMYSNYIVLELKGDAFIDKLYNDYTKSGSNKKLNKEALKESFKSSNK